MPGTFIISLDYELMWGVRDHATPESYGDAILGGREAIPAMLSLFQRYGIAATWATVGLLLARDRDTMIAHAPPIEARPAYADPRLSPYGDLSTVGRNETEDPLHYGLSIARRILETPGQTLGTHTFSHFYTCEQGATVAAFEADLAAAQAIAADAGLPAPASIVFPRNQMSETFIAACARAGIRTVRGNPPGFAHSARAKSAIPKTVRLYRLVDSVMPLAPRHAVPRRIGDAVDVPATRFLRPAAGAAGRLTPLHIRRILREMSAAAKANQVYHLWWHPHNFGRRTDANLAGLDTILAHYRWLAARFDFLSMTMENFARSHIR